MLWPKIRLAPFGHPLTRGREAGWPAWTFISFAASIPLLVLFIWFEGWLAKVGGSQLVDLKLFKNHTFVAGLAMAFLFYCISVFFLTFSIYLQSGLGWTSLASGIGILPFALFLCRHTSVRQALLADW